MDHAQRRAELMAAGLDVDDVPADPLVLLDDWLTSARDAGIHNADAMAVATADDAGRPTVRNVLMRGVVRGGLTFYTNYESDKGRELATTPACEALFSWLDLERQIRVRGLVERLSADESDTYWRTRPRGSQLAAWASDQSRPLASRAVLEERVTALDARHDGGDVPRPAHWGGYLLTPERVEFWQGREFRLHDRIVYVPDRGQWRTERLAP